MLSNIVRVGKMLRDPLVSLEAEEGLLAACLLDGGGGVLDLCAELKITPDCFSKPRHQTIFQSLVALREAGDPIDEIVLLEYLRTNNLESDVGGIAVIYNIQERIETSAHARHFANIVRDKYQRRSFVRLCRKWIEDAQSLEELGAMLGQAETSLRDLTDNTSHSEVTLSAQDVCEHLRININERINNPDAGKEHIVETHLSDLNGMFFEGGFQPSEMIVIGARPSVGKSALAMNIVEHAAIRNQQHAMIFSLEMDADKLLQRVLTSCSGVPSRRIRRGEMNRHEQDRVNDAIERLSEAPICIDEDPSNTIIDIRAKASKKAAQLKRKGERLSLVVIDYLQLLTGVDSKVPRREQVGQISRGCKLLAKSLKVPVLVLSQLNRDSVKQGRRPTQADLREAGDIEQDADVIILIHRREDNQADASFKPDVEHMELIIEKQRDGERGTVNASFVKKYTRFENFQHA